MNEKKILSLLGIAKKAGKTVSGTDMTVESIRKKASSVKIILLAGDASANTVKRIQNTSDYYKVELITLGIEKSELGALLGHGSQLSVVGVTDSGFAQAMQKAAKDDLDG